MLEIKYGIKITISLISSGTMIDISDNFITDLDLPDNLLYDNFHIIGSGYILDTLKDKTDYYLKANNLTRADIEVESYEILQQTSNVDVFFENTTDPNAYTLSPTIKAYVHPLSAIIDPPTLKCELITDTSIIWTWDATKEKDYAHYLLDSKDVIVAQLPINLNYYIESLLKEETMYTRKLIKYNATGSSKSSIPASITTGINSGISKLLTFKDFEDNLLSLRDDSDIKVPIDVISTNLEAFHSGIGDGKDLLVMKQSDNEFYEKFNLDMKIFGTYHKKKVVYDQVSFNYRFKASGQYIVKEQPGSIDIITHAYPVEHIIYRVYRYGLKPVTGKYRVKCDCHYYIKHEDGTYEPAVSTFTSSSFPFSFTGTATYDSTSGFAVCDFLTEANAKPIVGSNTIGAIMDAVITTNSSITASGRGYTTTNFQIEDDYQFDEANNRYSSSALRGFGKSILGTLKVCANTDSSGYAKNSTLYVYGFSEGCLYDSVTYYTHEVNLLEGTKSTLSLAEINMGWLYNIVDITQFIPPTDSSIIKSATVSYIEEDVISDYINTSSDPAAKCHINPNGPTVKFQSDRLTYEFSSDDPYTMIVGCYAIKAIDMSYNIDPITHIPIDIFNKREYIFVPEILATTGNIDLGLTNLVTVGQLFPQFRGEANYGIPLFSNLVDVTKTWETILPNPTSTDAMFGIVNGRFDITTAFSGKEDLVVVMPTFQIPIYVIPSTIRYSILLSNIYPELAFLSTVFTTRDADNYGVLNSDIITFSSDSMFDKNLEYTDLIETIEHSGIEMFNIEEKEFNYVIETPTIAADKVYEVYNLKVLSSSNNVVVSSAPDVMVFDSNNEFKFIIKLKGQQNATSHWSPRVHNGYYYLNNHEHFLYSKFKADGAFRPIQRFVEDEVHYTINCTLEKLGGEITHYVITRKQESEFISDRSIFDFKNDMLFPQPTLNSPYYKEYSETIYISSTIIIPELVTSYDKIVWSEIIPPSSSQTVYMRAFNVGDSTNGIWGDWVQVFNGQPMNLTSSSALQFKVIFEPKTTNVYVDFNETDNCEIDYWATIDTPLSYNISLDDDIMKCNDTTAAGRFYSVILDYGSTSTLRLSSFDNGKGIKMYVAGSNDKNALANSPSWVLMTGSNSVGKFRYLRYRIDMPMDGELYILYRFLNAPVTTAYVPGMGNVIMNFTHVEPDKFYSFSQNYDIMIPFDMQWHTVAPSIPNLIYPVIVTSGFDPADIVALEVKSKDKVSEIKADITSLNNGIQIRSLSTEFDTSLKSQYIDFIGDTCVLTGIPQQFCPVIVQDDLLGALQLVSFYDDNGNAVLTNTQTFISETQKSFGLSYNFIDAKTLIITHGTNVVDSTMYNLYNNIVEFNTLIKKGDEISISYMIINSFCVDSDINNNTTTIKVHTDTPVKNARIMFETNLTESKAIIGNLSLNPIYNLDNKGFVYISYDTFPVLDFSIQANPTTLKADGKDTIGVYISVIDLYSNPVPGETLNITCTNGTLSVSTYITDVNGVIKLRYTSPNVAGSDIITVICESTGLTKTITITNN